MYCNSRGLEHELNMAIAQINKQKENPFDKPFDKVMIVLD